MLVSVPAVFFALAACQPTCSDCDPPGVGLSIIATLPSDPAKGELPEGSYQIAIDTGRISDSCAFTLTSTGCADGAPNCVVDSTCAGTMSYNMDFGAVVPVFDVGLEWPELDDVDDHLDVTVTIDGATRVAETIQLTWLRRRVDPGPYSPKFDTCWCNHTENDLFVVVPAR